MPHVSRVNCCIKSLELSHSRQHYFAFSIATIITHFFALGTFLKYTQIEAEPEVHLCGELDFVTPRISAFAPVGNLGSGSEE